MKPFRLQALGQKGGVIFDLAGNICYAIGTTKPSDGASGYAINCLFVDNDTAGAANIYVNEGTASSCDFNPMTGGDLTELTASAAELNALDITAAGTAEANKALVLGAAKEIATITSATITNATVSNRAVAAAATEHGAGAIGTGVAPLTYRYTNNGFIITEIKVDLEGLTSKATANDVIGLAAGGAAYIGRNVIATNGVPVKMELICLETPTGGDNDVNVVANSSAVLVYDSAGGTTYGINGGDAVAGQVIENLVQGSVAANDYYYLTAGTGDTSAAYTAGQFIVRITGHPVLT